MFDNSSLAQIWGSNQVPNYSSLAEEYIRLLESIIVDSDLICAVDYMVLREGYTLQRYKPVIANK